MLIFGTGVLGGIAGLALYRFPENLWWAQLALSAAGTLLGLWWVNRTITRPSNSWMGLAPVLLLTWFVFATPSGGFIRTGSGAFSLATDVEVADSPFMFLIFDEFPVDVLLDSDLNINAERFPNFARLAAMSNWFPLASSVSGDTVNSVPAIVSGQRAVANKVPISEAYSTDLLRILSPHYDIASREAFTQMCSPSFCKVDGEAPKDPLGGLGLLLDDTRIVWQHAAAPKAWTTGLPPIEDRFVNFAAEYDSLHASEWAAPAENGAIRQLLKTENDSDRPMLWFGHFILPHFPYRLSPSGQFYTAWKFGNHDSDTRAGEIGRVSERQRLVYQAMAVDEALGATLDLLEIRGELENATIVVTADHGRNFWKGLNRHPPNDERLVQITSVPLFIKTPGQKTGEVRWDSASTMDIAPTVVKALGVQTDARFQGVDLLGEKVPAKRTDSYLQTVMKGSKKTYPGYLTPRQSKADLADLVDRMSTLLDPDGGLDEVLAIGTSGQWLGQPVDTIPASTALTPTYRDMADKRDAVIQVRVTGSNLPEEIIATRGDIVVGVGLMGAERKGATDVAVVVTDESVNVGRQVQLWAVYEDGVALMEETR